MVALTVPRLSNQNISNMVTLRSARCNLSSAIKGNPQNNSINVRLSFSTYWVKNFIYRFSFYSHKNPLSQMLSLSPFQTKETKAQTDEVTWPRSQSCKSRSRTMNLGLSDHKPMFLSAMGCGLCLFCSFNRSFNIHLVNSDSVPDTGDIEMHKASPYPWKMLHRRCDIWAGS